MTKDWLSYILELSSKLWPIRGVYARKATYQTPLNTGRQHEIASKKRVQQS